MTRAASLAQHLALLRRQHGAPPKLPPRTPLQWIVWENVGYLVDLERRARAYAELEGRVGLAAEELARAPQRELLAVTRLGGIHAELRAQRLSEIGRRAVELGGGGLEAVLRLPHAQALRALKSFPAIGAPGAEKILLFCGRSAGLPLESNGLRVLLRLGYGREEKSYASSYRSVQAALEGQLPAAASARQEAHALLRLHGESLCRRTQPACPECPLAPACRFAQR